METLEINNEIRTLQFEEKREVESILKDLTIQIGEDRDKISTNIRVLGELEFIQAKAKYSIDIVGNEPRLSLKQEMKLYNAYHPILLKRVGRNNVVPLDIEIDSTANTIVITGPNAGGKSVAMKTIGLLTVLAQAGCHIPASSESIVRICTDIFVDIGDDQSIEDDLSSFSSHLEKLKIILKHANHSSLILIDEIGSGTDPLEGSSLAAAFLENITSIGSINVVTTHHGNLKTFAFEHSGMENGAMEFDAGTLKPTYHFRKGVPGSSYAIEMAERISLPSDIIHRAMELKGSDAIKLERLILDLERKTQELK
ncbi:MAG TPA: endonuclease MutS2, partial [Bacteroidota bacterium]|nr:endonuclease MutS2 [Bacteroidota bacterium]